MRLFNISAILILLLLSACGKTPLPSKKSSVHHEEVASLIPIHYDYENLKLHLNASISGSDSKVVWKWDYMNSDNGYPDTVGVDFFKNHSQPSFSYQGEKTLPSLAIKTERSRIVEFSVTVIFNLEDEGDETLENLLKSLTTFDLLNNENVRQSILESRFYNNVNSQFEERLELTLSEDVHGYDRMIYSIKTYREANQLKL